MDPRHKLVRVFFMHTDSTFYINRWETYAYSHPVCEVGATTVSWFQRTKQKFHDTTSAPYHLKCRSYVNENQLGDVPLVATLYHFPPIDDSTPLAFHLEQAVIRRLRSMNFEEVHGEWFRCSYPIVLWIVEEIVSHMSHQPIRESKSLKLSDITWRINKGVNMPKFNTTQARPIKVLDWMLDKMIPADDVVCLEYNHRNRNGTLTPHWKFETDRGDYLYHCSTKKGYLHKKEVHDMLLELVRTVS